MKPQSEIELNGHVFVVADTDETMSRVEEMFSRVQKSLSAMQLFVDNMTALDEDAPDLAIQAGPFLERLMVDFIGQYKTPLHLQADIETLRRMIVQRTISPKGGH